MKYWIIINGQKVGPITEDELLSRHDITAQTPVWKAGLADWTTVSELPELAGQFPPVTPGEQAQQAVAQAPTPETPAQTNDEMPPCPRSWLGWNIAAAIVCCAVLGIIGIVFSAKVGPTYEKGDYQQAVYYAQKAKRLFVWAVVTGVAFGVLYFLWIFLVASESASYMAGGY